MYEFDEDGHNPTVYLSLSEMRYYESNRYFDDLHEADEQEDEDDE